MTRVCTEDRGIYSKDKDLVISELPGSSQSSQKVLQDRTIPGRSKKESTIANQQ